MIDIIFSINVHINVEFLIRQIKNIDEFVSLNYIIIINPNKYMYNEILKCEFITSKNYIILNNSLEKKRHHGSLTQGIYLNLKNVINKYEFKYFVILSSRNLFYNKLNKENYNSLVKNTRVYSYKQLPLSEWQWSNFLDTELTKYIIKNNLLFSRSAHEGLTFDYISCLKIIEFLDNNDNIKNNIFNWNRSIEEFALQTICINVTGCYYLIGQWCPHNKCDFKNIKNLPKNKYVYKTLIP